jgi:malate synthase
VNERALARVREDKEREAGQGFDGTWVAHPDLVSVAMAEFDDVLGERPNQVERQRDDVSSDAAALLDVAATGGDVTDDGVRGNVSVALRYIAAWLDGTGAVALDNLMEDAATAEIARSQLWQWIHHGRVSRERVVELEDELLAEFRESMPDFRWDEARAVLDETALAGSLPEFLTLPAYDRLEDR